MILEEYYKKENQVYFKNSRPEMLEFLPDSFSTVLDIGCGEGDLLMSIIHKHPNVEAWGVEPFADLSIEYQSKLKKLIKNSVENAIVELPDNYFDVIYMNDVLEHLIDPEGVLLKLKSKLTQNGLIITSIPNMRYIRNLKHLIWDKNFEYEDFGIRDKTHLRFFTRKSIITMFNRLGYEIVKIEGINKDIKSTLIKVFSLGTLSDTVYLQYCTVVKK